VAADCRSNREPDGLAWVEFHLPALRSKLSEVAGLPADGIGLNAYHGSLGKRATPAERYHFAAAVPRFFDPFRRELVREPVFEFDMIYDGDDGRGFNRFRVGGAHRGDEYKGASGAPILDSDGSIVALVQGGCPSQGVVFGVPLALYARALSIPPPPPAAPSQD
jgi:hypothetical protein